MQSILIQPDEMSVLADEIISEVNAMEFIDRISKNNARDRMIREKLEAHTFSDKCIGKPLNIISVNFTVPLEKTIMSYAGIPEYIQRAKLVEEKIKCIKSDLISQYDKLEKKMGNNHVKFNGYWKNILESYNFQEANELRNKHNLFYPQEANLRMDFDTGEYLLGSDIWRRTPLFSVSLILEELPFK